MKICNFNPTNNFTRSFWRETQHINTMHVVSWGVRGILNLGPCGVLFFFNCCNALRSCDPSLILYWDSSNEGENKKNKGNVNECCTALVRNLIKESFYGKRKKKAINVLITFFIFHKSDIKTFLKWILNQCRTALVNMTQKINKKNNIKYVRC